MHGIDGSPYIVKDCDSIVDLWVTLYILTGKRDIEIIRIPTVAIFRAAEASIS